jgi:hypothetical protein
MEKENIRPERRRHSRTNVILPIRFRRTSQKGKRKETEAGWVNSHISNVSPEGFCLDISEDLEPDRIIEFEYYRRGVQVSGRAKIVWKDEAKSVAGCSVLEYNHKEQGEPEETVNENDKPSEG